MNVLEYVDVGVCVVGVGVGVGVRGECVRVCGCET